MNTVIKGVLAVVAGVVVGSMVNMGLITVSGSVIPPPPGADVTTMEGLKASLHLFEPKHFVFPFLAHALGTLVGAAVAARIAGDKAFRCAMVIGAVFLCGGIGNVFLLPGPMWFNALDIVAAYLPMAWLGWRIGARPAAPA